MVGGRVDGCVDGLKKKLASSDSLDGSGKQVVPIAGNI